MSREVHVRFWEGLGVKFPRATHLVGWAASQSERLPNSSFKLRHLSLLDWEFLSKASMLPKSCR
jgi:hypothetical protein